MSLLQTTALLGSLASSVAAHGIVQGIVANGKWYQGYNPSFQFSDPPPKVIGWSVPDDESLGFVEPSNYTNSDIICHIGATPAPVSAKAAAGSVVELQWTPWPSSHHGPMLDYLAKCPGSCSDVDKTKLEFFKIDAVGLINDASPPGTWASDQMIANNNSWVVTIPKNIAPGNYVLRHETIALHSAGEVNGAQNYPQCINLEITGSGTETPAGTLGEKLYTEKEPGILINIYTSLATYKMPGPTLISGAVSMKQTEIPFSGGGKVNAASGSAGGASSAAPSSPASASAAPSSVPGIISSAPAAPSSYAAGGSGASSNGGISGPAPLPSSIVPSGGFSLSVYANSSSAPFGTGLPSSSFSIGPVSGSASTSTCTKSTITVSGGPGGPGITPSPPIASHPAGSQSGAVSVGPASASLPASGSSSVVPVSASALPSLPVSSSAAASSAAASAAPSGTPPPPPPTPPKGLTLKELMQWIAVLIKKFIREDEKSVHARDVRVR